MEPILYILAFILDFGVVISTLFSALSTFVLLRSATAFCLEYCGVSSGTFLG